MMGSDQNKDPPRPTDAVGEQTWDVGCRGWFAENIKYVRVWPLVSVVRTRWRI